MLKFKKIVDRIHYFFADERVPRSAEYPYCEKRSPFNWYRGAFKRWLFKYWIHICMGVTALFTALNFFFK